MPFINWAELFLEGEQILFAYYNVAGGMLPLVPLMADFAMAKSAWTVLPTQVIPLAPLASVQRAAPP
jgi:hypothetical protein